MATLDDIRAKRDAILALARKYGIRQVRLFGSVVRGEDRPDSDLDVLVDFEPKRTLLDLIGFEQDLEELFGRKVEVISARGLNPRIEAQVLREAVPL
jgi:predicted nucleotidyltransferase